MTQHYLDSLHDDITSINLSCNNLTILHDLSRFKYLKKIYYTNNQLTSLPKLNKNLQILQILHKFNKSVNISFFIYLIKLKYL